MNKKIFSLAGLILLLSSLLFISCTDLLERDEFDVDGVRNSIQLSYEFTETGSTFSWTKPGKLNDYANYYLISADSNRVSSNSVASCKIVASEYQYDTDIRIKKSVSSVNFTWRYNSKPLYLWVVTDNKNYNLGEFVTKKTNIERLKKEIILHVDTSDVYKPKFQWAVPASISINPLRFSISTDSTESYTTLPDDFRALMVNKQCIDSYYGDEVSIKANIFKTENNFKLYDIESSTNSPSIYYLWIQTEDGNYYNLGKFEVVNKVNIDNIRKEIKLSYAYTSVGTKVTWTSPTGLSTIAKFFVISEDSRTDTTGTVSSCFAVDTQYRETSYGSDVTYAIKPSLNSAEILKRPNSKYYLWVHTTDGNNYNLGEFERVITNLTQLKQSIQIYTDPYFKESFNSEGYVAWAFLNTIPVHAKRFVLSRTSSSTGDPTSCRVIKSEYLDDFYNDTVSISADNFTDKSGVRIYAIQAQAQLTEGYYLWIQIEDGTWYNLGELKANTNLSNAVTTEPEISVDTIRQNITIKSFLSEEGTTYCWSKPDGLKDMALYYMISENSSSETDGTLTCMTIPDEYRDTSYSNKSSILASINYVTFATHVPSTQVLYLWVRDKTTGTAYNLGKFEAVKTEINKLRNQIEIYGDPHGYGTFDPYGLVYWSVPSDITLNIMRFIITDDSSSSYSETSPNFSCVQIDTEYLHPLYAGNVCIKTGSKLVDMNYPDLDVYSAKTVSKLSSGHYLWVQIEDGSWYNLGAITVKSSNFVF